MRKLLQKMALVTGSFAMHVIVLACLLPDASSHQEKKPPPTAIQAVTLVLASAAEQGSIGPTPSTRAPAIRSRVGSRSAALPTPPKPVPEALPEPETGEVFFSASSMERGPSPVSEPDQSLMTERSVTGLPVRLRLYIDRFGVVVDVTAIQTSEQDQAFVDNLIGMFKATAFLPGRRDGMDMPSYLDLELLGRQGNN
ncbi:hypothetical protein [Actimicrobium sp. GrIS 1.19]|uniref:hypothetical protein n=1 Tax=Actimicrobium sp. GrIS 1.19 TaxID=3071708 RepID=UPI002E0E3175